ncbi:MAG TPA: biotin transporter BioY [Candidatus Limnocylindrales bacterium]|jgi:biotin transport system substrate-specific component|nr:biotin transporter BioY [Candidatus Limnocylindrales bacterium]
MTISMPRMDRLPAQERGVTIGDFLVPIRVSEHLYNRARHLALILLGTIVIAASAQVYIPTQPVPFTGQTFGVLLTAGALGFRRGLLATVLYLALGAIGLPIFAEGKHGVEWLVGATGGYLVGFVLATAIVGRLAELGWDRNLLGSVGAMVIGSVAIYAVGVPWLAAVALGGDISKAISVGLVPFLAWDVIKLVLAAVAFPAAWWFVGRRPGDR